MKRMNISNKMILRSRRRIRQSTKPSTHTTPIKQNLFNTKKQTKSVKVVVKQSKPKARSIIRKQNRKTSNKKNESTPQKKTRRIVLSTRISQNTRLSHKKQEEKKIKSVESNCRMCTRQIKLTKSESHWKDLCMACFAKTKGKIVNCSACNFEFVTLSKKQENYCYSCSIAIQGGLKKKCEDCNKAFYTNKDSLTEKTHCYTCYLKNTSNKIGCITCGADVFINEVNKDWKKKCYKCYLHDK